MIWLYSDPTRSPTFSTTERGYPGDLTGEIYASIDLLFFHIGWQWGISIPVFNFERRPYMASRSRCRHWGSGSPFNTNVNQNGGVLTFNGTQWQRQRQLSPREAMTR